MVTTLSMKNGEMVWLDQDGNLVTPINVLGSDGESEELVDPENEGSGERVWLAFKDTPEGAEYFQKYDSEEYGGLNRKRFGKIYETLFGDVRESCSRLQEAYRQAVSIGEFQAAPPKPAPPAAPRQRDAAGRYADERSRLLAERDAMLADPATPASAITARMRTDAKFRAAIENEGRPVASAASAELSKEERADAEKFAWAFIHAPKVQFLGGYATLTLQDGSIQRFTPSEWNAEFERAQSAGCLK
jgi:hypothetical protein